MGNRRLGTMLASLTLGLIVAAGSGNALAQKSGEQAVHEQPIYGSQLMTREERIAHRNIMRSLKTEEEREAYRAEHHAQMQERAKSRGLVLPDEPPPRGMGMGPGPGPGMGNGPGPGPRGPYR